MSSVQAFTMINGMQFSQEQLEKHKVPKNKDLKAQVQNTSNLAFVMEKILNIKIVHAPMHLKRPNAQGARKDLSPVINNLFFGVNLKAAMPRWKPQSKVPAELLSVLITDQQKRNCVCLAANYQSTKLTGLCATQDPLVNNIANISISQQSLVIIVNLIQALESGCSVLFERVLGDLMRKVLLAVTSSSVEEKNFPTKQANQSFPDYVLKCTRSMQYLDPEDINLINHVDTQALFRFIAFITGGDLFTVRFLELIQVSISTRMQERLAIHYVVNKNPRNGDAFLEQVRCAHSQIVAAFGRQLVGVFGTRFRDCINRIFATVEGGYEDSEWSIVSDRTSKPLAHGIESPLVKRVKQPQDCDLN